MPICSISLGIDILFLMGGMCSIDTMSDDGKDTEEDDEDEDDDFISSGGKSSTDILFCYTLHRPDRPRLLRQIAFQQRILTLFMSVAVGTCMGIFSLVFIFYGVYGAFTIIVQCMF